MLASFIPQDAVSRARVAAWASAHPFAERVVQALGLHHAFSAPLFLACVFALAVSTALCAWRRTRAAAVKARMLRDASTIDEWMLAQKSDLRIECDGTLEDSKVLSIATETLGRLGIRMRRRGDLIESVSPTWTVWGSPVFHWALVALALVVATGGLWRTSGIMGLAVGQAKPDQPASYGTMALSAGPLRDWDAVDRTIRVDEFDLKYATGGVDRGPTPLVTVLDAQGEVVKSQRVYPNHTLKTGSLTIYPSDYGLSATISIVDPAGRETYRSAELIDFSGKAEGGTVPAAPLVLRDDAGTPRMRISISVPLDRTQGGFLGRLPTSRVARVVVTSLDDAVLVDRAVRPGEEFVLPGGDTLRLHDVGYYARLQLVDDPSTSALYFVLAIAVTGLGVAALARQSIVVAAVVRTEEGTGLVVRIRFWRNVMSSLGEIEDELTKALGGTHGGGTA